MCIDLCLIYYICLTLFCSEALSRVFRILALAINQWHLIDSGIKKKFPNGGHEVFKGYLIQMIHARTEEEFDRILKAGMELLQAHTPQNG